MAAIKVPRQSSSTDVANGADTRRELRYLYYRIWSSADTTARGSNSYNCGMFVLELKELVVQLLK